jgi:hypothetical protein
VLILSPFFTHQTICLASSTIRQKGLLCCAASLFTAVLYDVFPHVYPPRFRFMSASRKVTEMAVDAALQGWSECETHYPPPFPRVQYCLCAALPVWCLNQEGLPVLRLMLMVVQEV